MEMNSKDLIDQLLVYTKDHLNFLNEYSGQAKTMRDGFTKLIGEIKLKLTEEEGEQWCKDNKCDFINPVFPPPEDLMWCENPQPYEEANLMLQCVFTVEESNPEIYREDVK